MREPVITVKNVSKSYNISHEMKANAGTVTFRDAIINTLKKPKELLTGHIMKKEKFWALKGIDFEINKGEVVGIIGKNGSGKSTLLKIMSRITEPTTGEIVMNGRVASLLEVGTGFHPELTGRENVYFNGSILGMKKKEIDAKFDEIVAFSEVEKFLDTPVKFYSSGMYVRLAFAVAAHLDPDILIIDEVLAVGDAAFQKKCLGKMKQSAAEGRTVLFVSHSMQAVQSLCSKAILLEKGKILEMGSTEKVYRKYLGAKKKGKTTFTNFRAVDEGRKKVSINQIKLLNSSNNPSSIFSYNDEMNIILKLSSIAEKFDELRVDVNVIAEDGHRIACFTGNSKDIQSNEVKVKIKNLLLSSGLYTANVSLISNNSLVEYFIPEAFNFEVQESSELVSGSSNLYYKIVEVS